MKLVSINIEQDKHLERVLPFLQSEQADILTLQEVFQEDLAKIQGNVYPHVVFAPMWHNENSNVGGVGIFSKNPIENSHYEYYVGDEQHIPLATDPNSINRVIIWGDIGNYQIATTHFTWSFDGGVTNLQRENFAKLSVHLEKVGECVLTGDFNSPRGGEMYQKLTARYKDNIPAEVTSTLDPKLHELQETKQLVVDYLFSTPKYKVFDVRIVEGISDHKAIVATVKKQ